MPISPLLLSALAACAWIPEPPPADEPVDADGDGALADEDCDDADPAVHPGAEELCGDGLDNDCDGEATSCGLTPLIDLYEADAKLMGSQYNHLGTTVLIADLDGDSGADLVAAAPEAAAYGEGWVYLFPGDTTGWHTIADASASFQGALDYDQAGTALAAGDLSGDGAADLIISAPLQDEGATASDGNGAVYLVPGPVSGALDLAEAVYLQGPAMGDTIGQSLGVGDLDGDEAPDLAIGSNSWGNTTNGRVTVVLGPISVSRSLDVDDVTLASTASSYAGAALAVADLDGDGVDDLVVGAPYHPGKGAVFVHYGPVTTTDLDEGADAVLRGEGVGAEDDETGWALAAGDLSGDGRTDLAVGARRETGSQEGHTYVWTSTPADDVDLGESTAKVLGDAPGDVAGDALAIGDFDGDTQADLAVGAWGSDLGGDASGAVGIYLGAMSGTLRLSDADQLLPGDAAGDADGDGVDDLLVGARWESFSQDQAGAAYLVLGGR